MAKITEKKLISQLQALQQIKPSTEWASLLKSQILEEGVAENMPQENPARFAVMMNAISSPAFRAAAYTFAAVAFLAAGVFGFTEYNNLPAQKLAEQSQANVSGQVALNQNITALNNKINNLTAAAKTGNKSKIPAAMTEINSNAAALVKSLKNKTVAPDSVAIKELATNLKTLSDVPGTDVASDQDVQNLEQTIVEAQIADLQKETLTDNQTEALLKAQSLYGAGNYQDALAQLLPPSWPSN